MQQKNREPARAAGPGQLTVGTKSKGASSGTEKSREKTQRPLDSPQTGLGHTAWLSGCAHGRRGVVRAHTGDTYRMPVDLQWTRRVGQTAGARAGKDRRPDGGTDGTALEPSWPGLFPPLARPPALLTFISPFLHADTVLTHHITKSQLIDL